MNRIMMIATCLLASLVAHGGGAPAVPDILYSVQESSVPVWVSYDAAFDEDQELMRSLFAPQVVKSLEQLRTDTERARKGERICKTSWKTTHYERLTAFDEFLDQSRLITRGRVSSTMAGLLNGRPGTLVRLSGAIHVKGPTDNTIELLYFPFAVEENRGAYRICTIDESIVPQPGDQVFVMSSAFIDTRDGYRIHFATPGQNVYVASPEGKPISVPHRLEISPVRVERAPHSIEELSVHARERLDRVDARPEER